MKEQYVGDVNDYRKYALLRVLSRNGRTRVGICWMLTPPDGRSDGNLKHHLNAVGWREYDPPLYDALLSVSEDKDPRRLRLIEQKKFLGGALFFREYLSDHRDLRRKYFDVALRELRKADLIFLDPDNGMEVPSVLKGRPDSSKYIYRDEIKEASHRGHSVLIYQHFSREVRRALIERVSEDLQELTPKAHVWAFRTPYAAFLLLVHPRHTLTIGVAAEQAATKWPAKFITGERMNIQAS